jgi:hypothetical protein
LKCVAGEEWGRSVGPIVWEMRKCCIQSRRILHTIKRRKANWIGHILHRNCILKHIIEGKMERGTEVRVKHEIRCKQLLDGLKGKNTHSTRRRAAASSLWCHSWKKNPPLCFHELNQKLLAAPLYVCFYLKEKRRFWKLRNDAPDHTLRRTRFGRVYETLVRQTEKWSLNNDFEWVWKGVNGVFEVNPALLLRALNKTTKIPVENCWWPSRYSNCCLKNTHLEYLLFFINLDLFYCWKDCLLLSLLM